MFRFLSRQAFKAVPRSAFRLSSGTTLRFVHSMQAPYIGLPSYDMIVRRFSSDVDPQAYFVSKRRQQAKERGEFVDIHDIGGPDPKDYDVLIPDIDRGKLQHEIADIVGIPYHSPASKQEADKVVNIGECFIYGRKFRTMFPAVVTHRSGKAYWVFFLVDTGSPLTYLSAQTSDLFGIKDDSVPSFVSIAGHRHGVYRSPTNSHFAEVDILGMDFTHSYNVSQWNDCPNKRAKLYIDGECWEVVGKPKL